VTWLQQACVAAATASTCSSLGVLVPVRGVTRTMV
jgi:hypothetical protein